MNWSRIGKEVQCSEVLSLTAPFIFWKWMSECPFRTNQHSSKFGRTYTRAFLDKAAKLRVSPTPHSTSLFLISNSWVLTICCNKNSVFLNILYARRIHMFKINLTLLEKEKGKKKIFVLAFRKISILLLIVELNYLIVKR